MPAQGFKSTVRRRHTVLQVLCLKNWRLIITQFASWKFVNRTRFCCVLQMGFIFLDWYNTEHVCDHLCCVIGSLNPRKETTPMAGLWKLPDVFMFLFSFVCYFSVQKRSLFLGSLFFFKFCDFFNCKIYRMTEIWNKIKVWGPPLDISAFGLIFGDITDCLMPASLPNNNDLIMTLSLGTGGLRGK